MHEEETIMPFDFLLRKDLTPWKTRIRKNDQNTDCLFILRLLLSPFFRPSPIQKTLWNKSSIWPKKYSSYVISVQSTTVPLKKGNAYFCTPRGEITLGKEQQLLTIHSSVFGQHSIMCFQNIDNLPKYNNADPKQFPREVRTSDRQAGRQISQRRISLWKGKSLLYLYSRTFLLACETCWRGTWFYFQPSIHANSLIQLLGLISIFKQPSLTMMLSACSTSFPKVITGQAWIPLLNFVFLKQSSGLFLSSS